MNRHVFALLLVIAAVGLSVDKAHATEVGGSRPFGLGFAIGTPSSIVGKVFVSRGNAIDFGLGAWGVGGRCGRGDYDCRGYGFNRVSINADYLWQDEIVRGTGAELAWHIGAGGRVWIYDNSFGDSLALGARMPVGLDLTFPKPNFLEVFLELAPAVYVVPGLGFDFVEAFLGVRFYF